MLRRHLNFRQISHRFTLSFVNPSFQYLNGSHIMYWNMIILNPSRFKVEPHSKYWYFFIERIETYFYYASRKTPCYFQGSINFLGYLILDWSPDLWFELYLCLIVFLCFLSPTSSKYRWLKRVEKNFLGYFKLNGCGKNHGKCKSATISLHHGDALSMSSVVCVLWCSLNSRLISRIFFYVVWKNWICPKIIMYNKNEEILFHAHL